MKKITLAMIASASMLLAAPAANNTSTNNGMYLMAKKGQENSMNMKGHCKCKMAHGMQRNRMKHKMKMNSPFLIKHGLPHLTKMVMPYLNDPAFNLTSDQKEQLAKVRKETMSAIMEAKPKIMALRKEIVNASMAGTKAKALEEKVAKLALLEAAVTMTHLKCIENTKSVLTKDQMYFLLANKNKMKHTKKKMMRGKGHKKMMIRMKKQQGMKCASGKCGQK